MLLLGGEWEGMVCSCSAECIIAISSVYSCRLFIAVFSDILSLDIALSPLADLRSKLVSSTPEDGEISYAPQRTLAVNSGIPTQLAFALNDERLVIGLHHGPVLVYDTSVLFSPGSDFVAPIQSFAPPSSAQIRQLLPNPGDLPELVAIRRETNVQTVEVIDVRQLQTVGGWNVGSSQGGKPTTGELFCLYSRSLH